MIGTIVMLLVIIAVLILFVFGNRINLLIEENFPSLSYISNYILDMRNIVIIISLFTVFVFIYRFVPNIDNNHLKQQIPGAIFVSIRMDCSFLFFFYLYKYIYKLFFHIWKSFNNNFNYDVALCNNIHYFAWSRNKYLYLE